MTQSNFIINWNLSPGRFVVFLLENGNFSTLKFVKSFSCPFLGSVSLLALLLPALLALHFEAPLESQFVFVAYSDEAEVVVFVVTLVQVFNRFNAFGVKMR